MSKKFASLVLVVTLVCTLCGPKLFAQNKQQPEAELSSVNDSPVLNSAVEKEAQRGARLKAGIQRLVADARTGKGLAVTDPQAQPAQSNSLSKTVKIGLVVGIALAVILIIVVVHAKNHLFDDFGPITAR
jgi:hypothetical protein